MGEAGRGLGGKAQANSPSFYPILESECLAPLTLETGCRPGPYTPPHFPLATPCALLPRLCNRRSHSLGLFSFSILIPFSRSLFLSPSLISVLFVSCFFLFFLFRSLRRISLFLSVPRASFFLCSLLLCFYASPHSALYTLLFYSIYSLLPVLCSSLFHSAHSALHSVPPPALSSLHSTLFFLWPTLPAFVFVYSLLSAFCCLHSALHSSTSRSLFRSFLLVASGSASLPRAP